VQALNNGISFTVMQLNKFMPIRTKKMDPKDSELDENTMELPEVKDIPGQEHIHVPPGGILADETASSADEEGDSILDDATDEDILQEQEDADELDEKEDTDNFPANSYPVDEDDRNMKKMALENKDDEGEALNEDSDDLSGKDLDVPGSDEDDEDEEIGEEDEENNAYSLPDEE
jgi:hypothetical protein